MTDEELEQAIGFEWTMTHEEWLDWLHRLRVLWCTANHHPGVS